MTNNEESTTEDHRYFNISSINKSLCDFRDEYNARLKLLSVAFAKIFTILEENNINPKILDNMTYMLLSEFNPTFEILEGKYKFAIDIRLKSPKNPKNEPHLLFKLANTKTNYVIEEMIHVYKLEIKLSSQFILLFKNNFGSYYKS